jgi:Uma2 family endonuclease
MVAPVINYVSAEDYLKVERAATEKHELHEGQIVTMSGASLPHNYIVRNLLGQIISFLKGKKCTVFTSDLRVHILTTDSFTYPDLSIVCGKPEMLDDAFDTLTNPSVLIEVMSRSTEKYDRGTKFLLHANSFAQCLYKWQAANLITLGSLKNGRIFLLPSKSRQ